MSKDLRYEEAIERIYRESPSFQVVGREAYHPGLETMLKFDALLGHPQKNFKSIHVAGTNGKGSVAHITASILASCGYRVGLYTSPHLLDFRERIKIVEKDIYLGVGFSLVEKSFVLDFLENADAFITTEHPSFFEITTAMAFEYFSKSKVDYAVVETGLGGRLDSTNIITPLLSVISSIGFDHKELLGDTISQIAYEKGGIIKPGVPVVIGEVPTEAEQVLSSIAKERSAPAYFGKDYLPYDDQNKMDLKGEVQIINLKTVSAIIERLTQMHIIDDTSNQLEESICHAAEYTGLRGRWEVLSNKPMMICDIGHNENALRPVMKQLGELFEKGHFGRLVMIYGMARDKDIDSVKNLLPGDAFYILTKAKGSRAMPSSLLREILSPAQSVITESVYDALSLYEKGAASDDLVYIGGSSYVVAEVLKYYQEK